MVDIDTLKTILRGLIVSNPGDMTVDALRRDYRTSEGHEIPFRQLGYNSIFECLQALTDTVRIRGNNVYAVCNQEMAHVESLVARQKTKRGKKKGGGFHRAETGRRRMLTGNLNRSYNGPYNSTNSRRTQYPTTQSSYQYKYGPPPPPRFVKQAAQEAACSQEAPPRSPEQYRKPTNTYFDDESDYDSEEEHYNEFEVVNGDASSEETSRQIDPVKNLIYERMDTYPGEAKRPSSCPLDMDDLIESSGGARGTVKDFLSESEDDDDDTLISDKMKKNLRNIVAQYPSGLWCSALPDEYLIRHGVPLDCRQLGFVSVVQLAMALPSIFRCVRVNEGDWKLFDARFPPPEQFLNIVNDDENEASGFGPYVPPKVLEQIHSILSLKSKAISINDFTVNYMIIFGVSIMDEVKGFKDVESLLKSVSNDIVVVKEVNGETLLSLPSVEGENAVPEMSWDEVRKALPPTACGPEDKCPHFTLPASVHFGDYIVVRLGEIYTPRKFWINLVSGNHTEKLEKLMDDIQSFYAENGSIYSAPCIQWQPGQHCVAMYKGEWHRAEISKVIDEDRVKVKYFDYGTIEIIPKTDLRLMDKQFHDLPKQAIKGKLSAIKPAKNAKSFSREVNETFFELVANKKLVGSVTSVRPEVPFISLALVDTGGGDDVHINDVLVEMGFAEFTSEEAEDEWTDESDEDCEETVSCPAESPFRPNTNKVPTTAKIGERTDSPISSNKTGALPVFTQADSSSVPATSASTLTTAPSAPPKVSRPPPGFQPLNPVRPAPPGMPNSQGGTAYYSNNTLRPTLPPGIPLINTAPPGIPPLHSTPPLLNPAFYNRLAFNQAPVNPQQFNRAPLNPQQFNRAPLNPQQFNQASLNPQQFNQASLNPQQFNYWNAFLLQQMATLRPANNQWAQFPLGVTYPRNQLPQYQLPVVNSNLALQSKPQPSQVYPPSNIKVISPTDVPNLANSSTNSSIKKTDDTAKTSQKTTVDLKMSERVSFEAPAQREEWGSSDNGSSVAKSLPMVACSSGGGASSKTPSPPPPPALTPPTPPPTPPQLLTDSLKKTLRGEAGRSSPDLPTSSSELPLSTAVKEKKSDRSDRQNTLPRTGPRLKIVWQLLDVHETVVHLLNYKKEGYVSTDEVAKYCLSLSDHSALIQAFESKQTSGTVTFQKVAREDDPEFFAALDTCPGLSKILNSEGKINLVHLKHVVHVIISIKCNRPKMIFAFQAARRDFNPDDEYWKQTC